MISYLKAEFGLCRKNMGSYILSICVLFAYCLMLLFSGVGGMRYASSISLFGFVDVIFFLIPWFCSPASFFQNRKKIAVSAEHMALMLGESKRTFVKTKIVICVLHCILMACVITLMQIPAYLIAGEQYSLMVYWTELMAVLGFSFLCMVILFLCPGHRLTIGLPIWAGFCGGTAASVLGDLQDMSEEEDAFRMLVIIAIVGSVSFVLSVLYRYIKTLCEERRGLPKKQAIGEE